MSALKLAATILSGLVELAVDTIVEAFARPPPGECFWCERAATTEAYAYERMRPACPECAERESTLLNDMTPEDEVRLGWSEETWRNVTC